MVIISIIMLCAKAYHFADEVAIIWAKWLIEHFIEPSVSEPPPDLIDKMFVRDVQTVTELVKESEVKSYADAHASLQKLALVGLVDTKIGLPPMIHNNAIYQHGYGSNQAQYVAHV